MTAAQNGRRPPVRAGLLAAALALVVLTVGAGRTYSGWATGSLVNSSASAQVAAVSIGHAYGSSSCSSTLRGSTVTCMPALGTASSPPASVGDTISNTGSVAVTQSVGASSCAPVQLANAANSSDPMLPRNDIAFAPAGGPSGAPSSGAVTLGASGYATAVAADTVSGAPSTLLGFGTYTSTWAYGIWFKTAGAGGRIVGMASNPTNSPGIGTTTFDRTLSLSGSGLTFSATGAPTVTSSGTYADGAWHYVYVAVESDVFYVSVISLSYQTTVTMYVDNQAPRTASNGSRLSASSGYWSLGSGFAGSLSNFAFYNGPNAPSAPPGSPYSSATDLWPLNDTGASTFGGNLPATMSSPCSKVNAELDFGAITLVPASLASLVGTSSGLGSLGPGSTQLLSIKTTAGLGYTSDLAGLHLLVPLTFTYTVAGSTSWTQTFTFPAAATQVFWA